MILSLGARLAHANATAHVTALLHQLIRFSDSVM
jgi:hypothetical protein